VVFYFVLILLGVGNPHRYLQFGIVAIKTSNFLPEFGPGKLVHPIPGPFFNTGISVLKNVNTGNTGIIPVLKLR
jgi:hypothetical protein